MHATYDYISQKSSVSQKTEVQARMVDDQRDDDQGRDNGFKTLPYHRVDQSELRNFSDESELFSDISKQHRVYTSQDSLEECLDQVYKPSRKQLELLQKHNVVVNGGILLVDPIGNEKVCLHGHNHSLTNNDLFIVQDGRCRDDDEFSVVSNVTEVTYGMDKRDSNLGKQSLGDIHNPLAREQVRPVCGGVFHLENVLDSLNRRSSCGDIDRQNGHGVFSTCDEILVCITSTYIADSEEMNDDNGQSITEHSKPMGLRCTWNEPAFSHKLGATFIEGSDGRAYVNQVIFRSYAASCGIKKGDAVSVRNSFSFYTLSSRYCL